MRHHLELYPPSDLESKTYRSAGWNTALMIFIPAIGTAMAALVGVAAALKFPWWLIVTMLVEGVVVGMAHDIVHDATHVRNHWLSHSRWYWHVRKLHRTHHRNMKKNLGILWFGWDWVFGTLRREVLTQAASEIDTEKH